MFLLDTNLVSELMRPEPDQRVLDWVAARPLPEMAVATVTIMEIRFGIAILPQSNRRTDLDMKFDQLLSHGFLDRILSFDEAAADTCADLRAHRRRTGRPIAIEDAMIAAIARTWRAIVVTRDVGGFEDCGLSLINPWEGA